MALTTTQVSETEIERDVQRALGEDIGEGDITAELLPDNEHGTAQVITRQPGVLCGRRWASAVFRQVDDRIECHWQADDGDELEAGQEFLRLSGPVRGLLTAERTALNFLQTLSGTATRCRRYQNALQGRPVRLLDTRKTVPGMRVAQKYAVRCGGCYNHRMGLYDAFLIKENHILASGGIHAAVLRARESVPDKPLEVEVETIDELAQAMDAGCDRVMLDNFDTAAMRHAVRLANGRVELEASGNVTLDTLLEIADTGVDFISIGALTKDFEALDLSMRLL